MIDCSTGAQKFWYIACIIWLICIFTAYRDELTRTARSAIVIVFIGGFPLLICLIFVARFKYRVYRYRHQIGNADPESSMISPEQREPPQRNDHPNPSFDHFLLTYGYKNNGKAGEGNDCVICLGQLHLQHGEKVVKIESCSHAFHEDCIDRWLRLHRTCPICRSRVGKEDDDQDQSVIGHISAVV